MSYIGFYTGYDKASKQLRWSNLKDFFLLNRGWDWTLVEANKALSLSALTVSLVSFIPQVGNPQMKKDLLFQGMSMLWLHSIYSVYKFYGYKWQRIMSETNTKKVSLVMGVLGQVVLFQGFYDRISKEAMVTLVTFLSIGHFYTYEIDYKGVLQVRPYALLPFPLAAGVYYLNRTELTKWIRSFLF